MNQPDITVILCTYNRKGMLATALDSLTRLETRNEFSYEVLIVDDGSIDGTPELVQAYIRASGVPMRYVRESGGGTAHARNRGIREASGQWVAFFDDDQLAASQWLYELYSFAAEKKVRCVGGHRRLLLTDEQLAHLSSVCRQVLGEIDYGEKPQRCLRKTFPGTGNMIIDKAVFERIGTFDDRHIWRGEDTELLSRARMAGVEAWINPRAVVFHQVPEYRLSEAYLIWTSLSDGIAFAVRDYREWGRLKLLLSWLARGGQALFVNLTRLALAQFARNKAEALGRKCLLARFIGYSRESLFVLAPLAFPQKTFFSNLQLRKETTIWGSKSRSASRQGLP